MENLNRISSGTIARTVLLVIALVNQILAIAGHDALPITEETVYQVVTIAFTAFCAILSWWKNNSFTKAARIADATMKAIKEDGDITIGEALAENTEETQEVE